MNTPSPLIPQGTMPVHGRSHVRIAVFSILAVHVLLLGALLLQGCKRTTTGVETATNLETTNENWYPEWQEPTNPTPTLAVSPTVTPLPATDPATESPEPVTSTSLAPPPVVSPSTTPVTSPYTRTPTDNRTVGGVAAPGAGTTHVIMKGDSFYVLAKKYHVSSRAIAEANPSLDPARLRPGEKINIPPPAPTPVAESMERAAVAPASNVHVVRSGDNLTRIAREHHTTIPKLRAANNLKSDLLKVGQKLVLPPPEVSRSATAPSTGPITR